MQARFQNASKMEEQRLKVAPCAGAWIETSGRVKRLGVVK